jgi:serine protease AprX
MKRFFGCVLSVLVLTQISEAQVTRYIIRFKDKGSNPYSLSNPSSFLTQRAITRRTKYSILLDSTDLPVTSRYIDSVRLSGTVTILNASKWLNAVAIQTSDATALSKINSFPFVKSVSGAALRMANPVVNHDKFQLEREQGLSVSARETGVNADYYNYGTSFAQVHIHNGEFLHNIGLRGQGMIIGMLDAGYNNYLAVTSLDSIRTNGQILGVYDFVAHDSSVNEDYQHGLECLSTIAANLPGNFVGTAPKSSFYLFRTEDAASEYPVEEFNWVCGSERVDSLGGDVISSSLGYTTFDAPLASQSHTYADMNGNTTMAAIGADLAAKKGILVVNAAGNDGTNPWHNIGTPADADSVMAVGAVTPTGAVASFSSYGPSADGQVKPDVASVGAGTIIQFPNNAIGGGNGTSFACPNLAGLTTCLWQGFPEFNNMHIINALRQAGNKASSPDDRVGYGIPDVKKAFANLLNEFSTASGAVSNCTAIIQWTSKDVSSMKYEVERKLPGQTNFIKLAEANGTGSTFGTRPPYQYQDQLSGVDAGTITYRIRQVIDTSAAGLTAVYIDTVTVNLQAACIQANVTDVMIAPNPAHDHLTVRVTTPDASSNIVIRIFNSAGQLMVSLNKSKPAGTAFFDNISLVRFAKDKYYVNVYDNKKLIATKELIKL